jgi:hypothetical protein
MMYLDHPSVHYGEKDVKDAEDAIKPLNVQMAIDFQAYFFREFETTQEKQGEDRWFRLMVNDFDTFLVEKKYLPTRPIDVSNKDEASGLIQKRNRFRNYINRASKRGLHGVPVYCVKSHSAGSELRVVLEQPYAAELIPSSFDELNTTIRNKLKQLGNEVHTIRKLEEKANIPTFLKDKMELNNMMVDDFRDLFLPFLHKMFTRAETIKKEIYRELERKRLAAPD